MADIVDEEIDELPARLRTQRKSRDIFRGCLTSALCCTNLRDRGATGPAVEGNTFSTPINTADGPRCMAFLKTGVWPKLLQLQQLLYTELRRDELMLELAAKPMFRFVNLLLAAPAAGSYIVANHCCSQAEVRPISRLMSLGDTHQTNQLEGLTNQAAAMLSVIAEAEGNLQFETLLCKPLSEEQIMLYGPPHL